MSGTRAHRIARRAEVLAGESRWGDLLAHLQTISERERLASSGLSYRFGEALYHLGRMDRLAAHGAAFEAAARQRSDLAGTMRALNLRGIAAFELGHTEDARTAFEALLSLAEAEGDRDMLARASLNLGALANLQGRSEEALTLYHLALPAFHRLRQTRGLAQTHQSLGMSYRDLGRYDEAEDMYREAEKLGLAFGYPPIVAMAVVGRAEVCSLRDDSDAAVGLAGRGLELSRQLSDPITEGTALRVRGVALLTRGHAPEAERDLERALELGRHTGHALLEAESLRDLARLARSRGQRTRARELSEEARASFLRLGAESAAAAMSREARNCEFDSSD